MKDNANLMEPKTLTRCGLWRMHKDNLRAWATGRCLLEHKDDAELDALTKDQLVDEVLLSIDTAEVWEDRRAGATDTVARPIEELLA